MPFAWKPVPGQVALIEVSDGGNECLTGVVLAGDEHEEIVIDLGFSPKPEHLQCEVVASFFAPDALYRMTATLSPHDGGPDKVIDLRVAATVSLLATFCAGAGVWISRQLSPTPINFIGVGIVAGSAFLLLVFLVRPLRKQEADVIIGDRTGRLSEYLARYARA